MKNNTFQVQVTRRGTITFPRELREHNQIETGDTLTLIDLGNGIVVMSPLPPDASRYSNTDKETHHGKKYS